MRIESVGNTLPVHGATRRRRSWRLSLAAGIAATLLCTGPANGSQPARESRGSYYMLRGKGYVLCERMLQRLQAALDQRPQGPVCAYDILMSTPGVSAVDWTPIDLKKRPYFYMRSMLGHDVPRDDLEAVYGDRPTDSPGILDDDEEGHRRAFERELELRNSRRPPGRRVSTEASYRRVWREHVDLGYAVYLWKRTGKTPEETDVLIASIEPGTLGGTCPRASTIYFSESFVPREWNVGDPIPINFGNRRYDFMQSVDIPSMEGRSGQTSTEVALMLFTKDMVDRRYPPDVCVLRRLPIKN